MKDLLVVVIGVFGLFHPTELMVRPAPGVALVSTGGTLADGESRRLRLGDLAAPFRFTGRGRPGDFVLRVPGKIERVFHGDLDVRADGGELLATVTMDLETAVASAVAAESPPGASVEALKAQAVVSRSFYAAGGMRHSGFDFCDTTHCQFLRHPPDPADPASLAAAQTRGLILRYEGRTLQALYSANCGGRTDTGKSRDSGYPYFAVACPRHGLRRGHGLGLCQEGAAAMARSGAGFRAILAHYYPNSSLEVIQ